ncbi:DUF2793 domain-containing protein [Metapseudomonas otitidis]|uniref:DUF2793 domain-containing protein n=1 Tax=Metapseudomonas otitidis TaxID=319939 RepID=UPI00366BC8EF
MTQSVKLALEYLQNSAANQVLANTTFAQLDQLVQAGVVDKDLSAPPGSPANGALYIVASSPSGAWSGKSGQLAFWLTSVNAWSFVVPREGFLVHVNDEDKFYKYNGSSWELLSTAGVTSVVAGSGISVDNTDPDNPVISAIGSSGGIGQNILVNSDFSVNQRGFAGGSLSAGSYGHDRWGAYNGGANYSVSSGTVTLTSGTICQVVESPSAASQAITVSVEDPSGTITVTLGNGSGSSSVSGTITAGSGRRGVTLTVPSSVTGDMKVRLSGSSVSFKRPKAEFGSLATTFIASTVRDTQSACFRYYYVFSGSESANSIFSAGGTSNNSLTMKAPLPVRMRAAPATTTNIIYSGYTAGPISSSQWNLAAAGVGYTTFSGTPGIITEGGTQAITMYIYGASASPAPNQFGIGSSLYINVDAELACTD